MGSEMCIRDSNNSEDSRFASVGMVKRKNVVGKVWMVIEPFDSFGFVK